MNLLFLITTFTAFSFMILFAMEYFNVIETLRTKLSTGGRKINKTLFHAVTVFLTMLVLNLILIFLLLN
jgi:hypothetical protein